MFWKALSICFSNILLTLSPSAGLKMLASSFSLLPFSLQELIFMLLVRAVRVFLKCLNYVCILVRLDWISSANADVK